MKMNRKARRALNKTMKQLPKDKAFVKAMVKPERTNANPEWRRKRLLDGWARLITSGDKTFYIDCVVDWREEPLPEYLPTVIYPQHFEVWEENEHLGDFAELHEAIEFIKRQGEKNSE